MTQHRNHTTLAIANVSRRGLIKGVRPGWKKAIVQVREGETIPIFEGAQV